MTYSIVTRDPETGEFGVAIQSRSFGAGAAVPWLEPGVGAVATQAFGERSYGPLGLELMRSGKPAGEALAELVAKDERREYRQVAMVDAEGRTAIHVGGRCIPAAGFAAGEAFSAQGNTLAGERVWEAMAEAFESAEAPLAHRLLAALEAAEAAGGDWRGKQAGAIVVVPAEGRPWEREVDVRVDDHTEPLQELRRLLELDEAYSAAQRPPGPTAEQLARLPELDATWTRIFGAATAGRVDEGRALLQPLLDEEPRWADYVRTIAELELVPNANALLDS